MPRYELTLHLDADRWRAFYEGRVRQVQARDDAGRWLRFDARHLRPYTSHDGVHGRFRLTTDDEHRFQSLEKIG